MGALGSLVSIYTDAANAIGSVLGIGGGGSSGAAATVASGFDATGEAIAVIDDVFQLADKAMYWGSGVAHQSGTQLDQVGVSLDYITHHTYNTVIPKSMSWLRGYMILHIIDPIRKEISTLFWRVGFLLGWRSQIVAWRNRWVDPSLKAWWRFSNWFHTWPIQTVTVVHNWLVFPARFSEWAVPIIARPLVNYYSGRNQKPLRDYLTAMVVDASPDVYRHAVAAFESMLDEPWP